ncbi:MAG: hypothetical protein ACRCS9_05965 [Hyphomicrobium sp.]
MSAMRDYDVQTTGSLDTDGVIQRMRLFLNVVAIVLVLSLVKAAIHWVGFEFLTLNPLFTSAIGGAIFIIGFLLSSILADYKEAERLPADIRVALEAIHDDVAHSSVLEKGFDLKALRDRLIAIVRSLRKGLSTEHDHGELRDTLGHVDALSAMFGQLDRAGMQPNFVTRLRGAQDVLRRSVFRIYHIQSTQFVPSIHILVYSIVASVIFLLLFLETEGSPESALMFGFVSYMFIYALHLISMLEKPFRKGHDTLDDVSLFLLREFDEKLSAEVSQVSKIAT